MMLWQRIASRARPAARSKPRGRFRDSPTTTPPTWVAIREAGGIPPGRAGPSSSSAEVAAAALEAAVIRERGTSPTTTPPKASAIVAAGAVTSCSASSLGSLFCASVPSDSVGDREGAAGEASSNNGQPYP